MTSNWIPRTCVLALLVFGVSGCADSQAANPSRVKTNSRDRDGAALKTSQPGTTWTLAAPTTELRFAPETGSVWDVSKFGAVRLAVRNSGKSPATVRARLTNAGAAGLADTCQTAASIPPGESRELEVAIVPTPPDPGFKPFAPYLRYYSNINVRDNTIDPTKVDALTVWLDGASAGDASVVISDLRLHGTASARRESFFPFIDEYGQYVHADWPGKIRSDSDFARSRAEEKRDLAAFPGPTDRSKFGGWASGPQLRATGNFYVIKRDGKWWLVDPEGKLFWSYGPTGAGFGGETSPITGRESWFVQLPPRGDKTSKFYTERSGAPAMYYKGRDWVGVSFYSANIERKYGPDASEELKQITVDRLKSWGFNSLGNWSTREMMTYGRMPYVTAIHYGSPMVDDHMPDIFAPEWESNLKVRLEKERDTTAKDPWNIGYFVDNERRWGKYARAAGVALSALECPPTAPVKIQFVNDLKAKYGAIAKLNESWGTSYASWEALLDSREKLSFEQPKNPDLQSDCGDFGEKFAERYFSTCRRLVKEVAPNHLYLGARLNGHIDPSLIKLQTKYCDVISYNIYDETPDGRLNQYAEIDFPFMVTEWGIDNDSRQSPFRASRVSVAIGRKGDRSEGMARYARAAIMNPKLVGAHFFQYKDQPLSGRYDGEALLRGFINVADTPNFDLVHANRKVAYDLYRNRAGVNSVSGKK